MLFHRRLPTIKALAQPFNVPAHDIRNDLIRFGPALWPFSRLGRGGGLYGHRLLFFCCSSLVAARTLPANSSNLTLLSHNIIGKVKLRYVALHSIAGLRFLSLC